MLGVNKIEFTIAWTGIGLKPVRYLTKRKYQLRTKQMVANIGTGNPYID